MAVEKIRNKVNKSARGFLQYGALYAPFSMMIYNLLIYFDILSSSITAQAPTPATTLAIAVAWAILGIATLMVKQPKNTGMMAVEVGSYYALAALQAWFVSGIASAFTAYWVMLLVGTYILLDKKGLLYGFAVFIGTVLVDSLIFHNGDLSMSIVNTMTIITILAASIVVIAVHSTQHTSYQELIASHMREESERKQNLTLINSITDSVFSIDANGIVITYNAAALNMLDTNHTIEGKYISDLMKLETVEGESIDMFEELSSSGAIRRRDDIVIQLADDDEMRLEATFAPVQGSGDSSSLADSYVLILRDITRMKSLEEERDEFISVVSHELRTPVTIAEGSLSNAHVLAEREGQDQIAENVDQAHSQILYLAKMVNNLSTLSRAERGISGEDETIDVVNLAHQLHSQYSPEAEEVGLQFNLDIIGRPSSVKTSRLYLQELLQNFITNAIKYTEKGSVTLHIEQVGPRVEFAVSDTGIGIGRSDLKRIFSRFYRAEDYRTRETNGTGLGLYVSAKLAKKIGSKISVESRLNHGSTFKFKLDANEEPSKAKQ